MLSTVCERFILANLRMLIMDSDPVFTGALKSALERLHETLKVELFIRDSAVGFISGLGDPTLLPDVAVYDLDAAEADGCDGLLHLKKSFPLVSFIVYSASNSILVPQYAFAHGAAGFFRRDSEPETVASVVSLILGAEAFAVPDYFRLHASSIS